MFLKSPFPKLYSLENFLRIQGLVKIIFHKTLKQKINFPSHQNNLIKQNKSNINLVIK